MDLYHPQACYLPFPDMTPSSFKPYNSLVVKHIISHDSKYFCLYIHFKLLDSIIWSCSIHNCAISLFLIPSLHPSIQYNSLVVSYLISCDSECFCFLLLFFFFISSSYLTPFSSFSIHKPNRGISLFLVTPLHLSSHNTALLYHI